MVRAYIPARIYCKHAFTFEKPTTEKATDNTCCLNYRSFLLYQRSIYLLTYMFCMSHFQEAKKSTAGKVHESKFCAAVCLESITKSLN